MAISEREKHNFHTMRRLLNSGKNVLSDGEGYLLLETTFDRIPTATICYARWTGDRYSIIPLAVMVAGTGLEDRLRDPDGEAPMPKEEQQSLFN